MKNHDEDMKSVEESEFEEEEEETECIQQWLECFVCVKFDLELGQSKEEEVEREQKNERQIRIHKAQPKKKQSNTKS